MTVRRLALLLCALLLCALLLCALLAVTQVFPGVPRASAAPVPTPPAHARPAAPPPMETLPCCCRPGHCRMAMCHGNPDYARTHPALLSCACGMAPRPVALTPDGGHRRGPLVGVSRCAPPAPRRLCLTYLLSNADTLRVRPASPLDPPPRGC